ncbi:MAG: ATP-dependent DNA helicase RecG [Gammaproteobacteria bacterium]
MRTAPLNESKDNSNDPLAEPVTTLRGVGPSVADKLARIGIETLQDLLFHLPLRYEDRTRVTPIGALRPGKPCVIVAEVQMADVVTGRRRMLVVRVTDGTGFLTLRFFHFSRAQQQGLARGSMLRAFGEVRVGPKGLELVHPEYRLIDEEQDVAVEETLTPIYPLTEGLGQHTLRRYLRDALKLVESATIEDRLPAKLLPPDVHPSLTEAVRYLHAPPPDADLDQLLEGEHPAQRRLAFEELLAHNLVLRRLRAEAEQKPAPPISAPGELSDRLERSLPFKLTGAQSRVVGEVIADMGQSHPMQRLVQGDVGSGKTIVAALCALRAIEQGYQVAVMAPTEILAEQHFKNMSAWLEPMGLSVVWLSGKQKAASRRQSLEALAAGQAHMAVGTHALFQDQVEFHDLALVVVDEQHRFGVHQRLQLREKGIKEGRHPHQLIMTATPIPRTLAMTAYADLDVSLIDEKPPGRKEVLTVVVSEGRRDEVVERIQAAVASGRQVYWVCTLIEESEALEAQAAEDTAALLDEQLPDIRVGLVHGRMKPAEKESVMSAFKAGEIGLLVATTVIEVGVDVPNASLMVIENAERLGLSQLHQLRGRVGRGSDESSCVLFYKPPLSDGAKARLTIMRETNDGFAIAEEDLKIRGPGEVLGTRQTGAMQFRIADLGRDAHLLPAVRHAADSIVRENQQLVPSLTRRWVGEDARYGEV